jgi:predicted transcriptional regulator
MRASLRFTKELRSLQVVAAIKGVTTDAYLQRIKEFEKEALRPELVFMRKTLIKMTEEYEQTVQNVVELKDEELLDFHATKIGGNGRQYHHGLFAGA